MDASSGRTGGTGGGGSELGEERLGFRRSAAGGGVARGNGRRGMRKGRGRRSGEGRGRGEAAEGTCGAAGEASSSADGAFSVFRDGEASEANSERIQRSRALISPTGKLAAGGRASELGFNSIVQY